MAFVHVVLGLLYGDILMAIYFGAIAIIGFIYGALSMRLPHRLYVPLGEFLIVVGVAGSQFVLPVGSASAIFLFPLGVSLLAVSHTLVRGGLIFIVGLALFFLFPLAGFESPSAPLVPGILSFGATLIYCGLFLLFQVSKARENVDLALGRLLMTEVKLFEKESALKQYEASLSTTNSELGLKNSTLLETLAMASKTNEKLESERAIHEELTKAIHRDLRDPLKSIVVANEQLHQRLFTNPLAASIVSYLEFATDGARRMTTMLDDLLSYTKGDEYPVIEEIDLDSLMNSLRKDLSDLITRSGALLDVSPLPTVEGYPTQMFQLFQNLLSNALKFNKPGVAPRVRIFPAEVQDKPEHYMIRVRDNGVGIPANQLENVFGLFNRAHTDQQYEGSGVGLALCKRIAMAHNADLTVTSVLGEGTEFTIAFPVNSIVEQPFERSGAHVESLQIT